MRGKAEFDRTERAYAGWRHPRNVVFTFCAAGAISTGEHVIATGVRPELVGRRSLARGVRMGRRTGSKSISRSWRQMLLSLVRVCAVF